MEAVATQNTNKTKIKFGTCLLIGGAGLLCFIGYKAFSLWNMWKKLEISPRLAKKMFAIGSDKESVLKDAKNGKVDVIVKLTNYTSTSLTIQKPTAKLYNNGEYIAGSDPTTEKFTLAPNTATELKYSIKFDPKIILPLITDFVDKKVKLVLGVVVTYGLINKEFKKNLIG